jgi:hypothetical protein
VRDEIPEDIDDYFGISEYKDENAEEEEDE